ncbi:unnamed protein product [Rotaria sp. Silwood2]|nr:unnamed protein product [Rotaria sp. Silwood2]
MEITSEMVQFVKQLVSPVNIAGSKVVEDPIKISTPYGGRFVWLLPGKNPLDGDVDFKLEGVLLLVDRMRKNRKVAAVFGRIHPTGDGCFYYFVLHHLWMNDNVMRRYANKSTETTHYVQYDQGKNRWLKTLLIQQGYRVEYCAASYAYIHAQEIFKEFFTQRCR